MNLSIKVLGFEIARVELDLGESEKPNHAPLPKATKFISRLWVRGMTS